MLAAESIALRDLDSAIARKLPRYPVVPAALLGRVAVAVTRVARAELGIFAMVVNAKDDAALPISLALKHS